MFAVDQILRVPLIPVLAVQGLLVRRKAQMLPEPVGPRQGQRGSGPMLRLLIAGDSSAAGVGVSSQNEALSGQIVEHLSRSFTVDWQLEATTGHVTNDTIARLKEMPEQRFDAVVYALGVNDVTSATTARQFRTRQGMLLSLIQERFCPQIILTSEMPKMEVLPIFPQPLAWVLGQQAARLDQAQATLTKTVPNFQRVPLDVPKDPKFTATDGFHPNAEFYRLWGQILGDRILSTLR